jgi:hypothetical protein
MSARCNALQRDQRGGLMLEALIALTPVLLLFAAVCQTCDAYAHRLIVQRAAAAAVRAAVVILPDDGARYGDPGQRAVNRLVGERKRAVEAAALSLLHASPQLSANSSRLEVTGSFQLGSETKVQLSVDYTCLLPGLPLICGRSGKLQLQATAQLTYQGARYCYPERG